MLTAADIERARSRWDIVAGDLPLKRKGRELAGLCPFHSEKSPSFYVNPDKGFFHCFGCGAHGDVIAYMMRTRHLTFPEAVHELADLPQQRPREAAPSNRAKPEQPGGQPQRDTAAREAASSNRAKPEQPGGQPQRDTAADIAEVLGGCGPVTLSTAAGVYLSMRGLVDATKRSSQAIKDWSGLLAHPALYCHEVRRALPALVAPVTNSLDVVTAVQRIWVLDQAYFDGSEISARANRPGIETRKKSLGHFGDGVVRLAPAGPRLGLAEGVETGLAAMRIYRVPVWVLCGTARFGAPAHDGAAEREPSLWVPGDIEHLVIFGDRGLAGETCATHAAEWFSRNGLPATAVFPGAGFSDFNDQLVGVMARQGGRSLL
jgi:hypothetical protein